MENLRLGLAQINVRVGDIDGNLKKILKYIKSAENADVDILCFPELAITGYPPEDLLLKPGFIDANIKALDDIRKKTRDMIVVVGFADRREDIYNAAAILKNRSIIDVYCKRYLPNYGVFDENRYFQSGTEATVYKSGEAVFGVNICEDIWYPGDPTRKQSVSGDAQLIINLSSSPYYSSKVKSRERMLATRARDYSVIVAFCNLVGGQDELVFDGHSVVIDEEGGVMARAGGCEEELLLADVNMGKVFRSRIHDPRRRQDKLNFMLHSDTINTVNLPEGRKKRARKAAIDARLADFYAVEEEIFRALVLGTRDYVSKNGFRKVVIGMSGGVDSALVSVIAVEALGKGNVAAVSMPSQYSSGGSVTDSEKLARNLGIELMKIPIMDTFDSYLEMMKDAFGDTKPGTAEENLQARIRGNVLMALSNKFGWLVLTTGNKSEMSVGYCTIYGDMAGGFAVIKDVPKTMVYRLARFYNSMEGREIVPKSIITKPPSAELRPDQLDTDSLPPYEELDPVLKAYVEDDLSVEEIAAMGFRKSVVKRIVKMVDLNEYKRRQAPPGIKITERAFGRDRRFPITNLYKA